MKRLFFFILALMLTCPGTTWAWQESVSLPADAAQPVPSCFSRLFPHQLSDLQPDPRLRFGRLANGFGYMLMANSEPRGRVAMSLAVASGSLNESPEQRGLAHFLEHMMFNGTKHFPAGKLVAYFQSIGMSFGGDINAHTSFDETVYRLLLPTAEPDKLRDGLVLLADYARGALLSEDEVVKERGVILAEMQSRDSAAYRARLAHNREALAGSRYADRQPIGLAAVVEQVTSQQLRQFYDAWYRLDNMVLIVVGDMDPIRVEEQLRVIFEPLQAAGSAPVCPDPGQLEVYQGVRVLQHADPQLGATVVSLERYAHQAAMVENSGQATRQLHQYLAAAMLNTRLRSVQEKGDAPLTSLSYAVGEIGKKIGYAALSARSDAQRWPAAFSVAAGQLQQALQGGFSEAELTRAKKEVLAQLEKAVQTATSKESPEIVATLVADLREWRVSRSPEQEIAFYTPLLQATTLVDVNTALRNSWPDDHRLLAVSGEPGPAAWAEQQLRAQYAAVLAQPAQAAAVASDTVFPYLPVPEAVAPLRQEQLPALDAERLDFANGVSIFLKKTDFERNTVRVRLDVGNGRSAEPQPGLAVLAEQTVAASGTGRMLASELAAQLAGSSVATSLHIDEQSLHWDGSALRQDSGLLLQLLHTLLLDAGFREEARQRSLRSLQQRYRSLQHDLQGAYPLLIQPFLASGDPRFGLPPPAALEAIGLADIEAWLRPQLAGAPLQVTVVGDFDEQDMRQQLGRYFGSLPDRQQLQRQTPPAPLFPSGKTLQKQLDAASDGAVLTIAWPTGDFWDIGRTRRLQLLAAILENRLRETVREALGASYSPSVRSYGSRSYPGYGYIAAQVQMAAMRSQEIARVIEAAAAAVAAEGISEKELAQVQQPVLTTLQETVRSNQYWLHSVLALASRHPQQLEWPVSLLAEYQSVNGAELQALAGRYLRPESQALAIISPQSRGGEDGRTSLPPPPPAAADTYNGR